MGSDEFPAEETIENWLEIEVLKLVPRSSRFVMDWLLLILRLVLDGPFADYVVGKHFLIFSRGLIVKGKKNFRVCWNKSLFQNSPIAIVCRFLRNKIVIANERPSSVAALELGLLRQRHTVSGLSCLAGSLVEQLWNFAWPAAIALIHRSFLPVAVIGFFGKLSVIVGGPLVGKLMDYFPRVPAYNCLTIIQIFFFMGLQSYVKPFVQKIIFSYLSIAALAVERISGLALGVAMERDWVVLLAGTNRPIALAQTNAILSRIDLLCEMARASLFGIFLSNYETVMCLKLAARLMMWSLPILVVLTWLTNTLSAGVLGHAKCPHTDFGCLSTGSIHDAENILTASIEATKHGWFEYIQQPVLPASLAYVLLYFNVALGPGGLMTAFLTQHVPNFWLYFKPQLLNMTHFIPPNLLHLSNFSITPGYQQHTK
ncbi:hypothetical protein ACS0TY_004155 [Phlomoides rotata]